MMWGKDANGVGHLLPIDHGFTFMQGTKNNPPMEGSGGNVLRHAAGQYVKKDRPKARDELVRWAEAIRTAAEKHERAVQYFKRH